jgi:hypothetical protein
MITVSSLNKLQVNKINNAVLSVQIFIAFQPKQVVKQMVKCLHEKYIYIQKIVQQNHSAYCHFKMLLKNSVLIHASICHNINFNHTTAQAVSHQPLWQPQVQSEVW